MSLAALVIDVARRSPDAVAVEGPEGSMTYGQLDERAGRLVEILAARGIEPGDRVALWLGKSAGAVVAMQAALRCGACYVPIDPSSPSSRARRIIVDCGARALVVDEAHRSPLERGDPPLIVLEPDQDPDSPTPAAASTPTFDTEQLAFILYTSGSTGTPKGVCISHRAALAFVRWAHATVEARPADRFSSHAPFHFDLSVLDLYAAFMAGARVCLIPEGLAYAPARLVEFMTERRISVWYSVPSVLMLMMEHGGLLELSSPPRVLLFAGEAFPIKHLRRLWTRFSGACRLLNLYGPTETNVCTAYEVTDIDPERATPVPIGKACAGDEAWVITSEGERASPGETGELWVDGPTVMSGYWGQPRHTGKPYATGDIVRVLPEGGFEYVGRRDHMVKVRGMRIELGEIEAALLEHPGVGRVAVVVHGDGLEARLVAFVVPSPSEAAPSLLALKRQCASRLPRYMVIDHVRRLEQLPHNVNGKVDRRVLADSLRRDDGHARR